MLSNILNIVMTHAKKYLNQFVGIFTSITTLRIPIQASQNGMMLGNEVKKA